MQWEQCIKEGEFNLYVFRTQVQLCLHNRVSFFELASLAKLLLALT